MNIIDISPSISENTVSWPGDTVFSRKINMRIEHGDLVNLSSITSTLHIGAHVDAPSHILAQGRSVDKQSLSVFYGKCQLVEVEVAAGNCIFPGDIKDQIKKQRILLKTQSYNDSAGFNNRYNGLSRDLIEFFQTKKIKLVGIDTPSVDVFEDKSFMVHKKMAEYNMAILEGLVLRHVLPGIYTLIAFPLKIENADASPVRAVLIK